MAEETREDPQRSAVRVRSPDEEVEPARSQDVAGSLKKPSKNERDDLCEAAQKELKNLSISMRRSKMQCNRMENFAFDPMSLPASRVPSRDSGHSATPVQTPSGATSPRLGSSMASVNSPPLTPAGSGPERKGASQDEGLPRISVRNDAGTMTPEISPPHERPPTKVTPQQESRPGASTQPRSAAANARLTAVVQPRPRSMVEMSGVVAPHPAEYRNSMAGPAGDSLPPSHDGSPANTPGAVTPPGARSPYQRPFTPQGDPNDPYARGKRPVQNRDLDTIDPRFVFGVRDRSQRRDPISASSSNVPRSKGGTEPTHQNEKRPGFLGGSHHRDESSSFHLSEKKHGSMSDLKRFFKFGSHKKDKDKGHKKSGHSSSSSSLRGSRPTTGDRKSSSNSTGTFNMPFADDMSLESKYGKFGKVLGSGAGGSVRIMKRQSDGVTFAVKQFRARHTYESEKEYSKKVTAEFCIGSTLHHGNLIETMDIIHEKGNWYEVMEYAPYDLFAIVMTGKMSREEITCATLQILNGVTYLHNMGLAHRDLKLDNVVVNEHGIMKIIDFGSAAVFRYPFENGVVTASGIVGSDPYLAPEVYDLPKYDPQPTDVWSLAIIFCCMTLRRFPWKQPRLSDNSYKLFVADPDEESRKALSQLALKSALENPNPYNPTERFPPTRSDPNTNIQNPDQPRIHVPETPPTNTASTQPQTQPAQPQQIKGRWRLLRLLPRETRHIISRMLELDPLRRATLAEIWEDRWVKTAFYGDNEGGTIIRGLGHTHVLEPGSSGGDDKGGK
ncbi:Pkinase-domain-containing protein [Eremomyces bilateralis CBS 781.70]|uniref:non-specific serine/threonine protein kinase n=1 Tax=Eremomyces bilateralis CBS 781.70 TaxID=1392243 RepID=A0A6G1GGY2_9PEZI|nr:Pkinase-domain-containing protein [Eremomyces bilateralis CBS 781.70]KAF1817129.1 Pkinase-domain-containing protein [Eremomyces bilateralis CBS 781.70]